MAVVFRWQSADEVHDSNWGREESKAESQEHQFLFHSDLLSSAMSRVPEQGKDIRDRHHVLELFGAGAPHADLVGRMHHSPSWCAYPERALPMKCARNIGGGCWATDRRTKAVGSGEML
jgi:hypothetical protein